MTQSTIARVKGIPVELGGNTYVLPPLSLGALEQMKTKLKNFTGDIQDVDQISTVIDAAHAALKRNYPEVTREFVAEHVGLENFTDVFMAVMDVSGVARKAREAGEAAAGETKT